jgi:hypothetical protein
MFRNLIFIFIFIFFSGIAAAQFITPQIKFNFDSYDFGKIEQGIIVDFTFEFENSGGDTLNILNVSSSCGCAAALLTKRSLTAGEKGLLKVTYDSNGRIGKQTNTIYVYSNDPMNPQKAIVIKADVFKTDEKKNLPHQPKIEFDKIIHDFGIVEEAKIYETVFKFTNVGKGTLEIKDIQTSCGCTAAFPKKRKLESGESSEIRVELDTVNRFGSVSRLVTVKSNDPDIPEFHLTIKAEIVKR